MYDSFDMACHDASSALQLNIKVNSENLLPNAQKYNVGSLRLPADPSWPKIPQRRMADDLDGIIEPPCVVTLTGTPRKSRTTVRASHFHQSTKPSFSKDQIPASFHHTHHKVSPTIHPLKRRPGCADPRFKRVTTVKSQVTSNDPPDRDNPAELSRSAMIIPNQTQSINENVRKTVPEKDTNSPKVTQQEAEKPGEIRGMGSVGVQTMPTEETSKIDELKSHQVDTELSKERPDSKIVVNDAAKTEHHKISPREISDNRTHEENDTGELKPHIDSKISEDYGECELSLPHKISSSKEEYPVTNLSTAPNTPISVQSESTCLQYCQGNSGQFFLVVENKVQAPSLSALQIDPSPVPSCQYTTQCYNVQVPVLTYQNLPLQISTQGPTTADISSQLSLPPVLTISSTPSLKNPANISFDNSAGIFSRMSEVPETKAKPEPSMPTQKDEVIKQVVKNSNAPEESVARSLQGDVNLESSKKNCNLPESQEESGKHLISSDVATEQARKTLVTPPIKLGRKHDDNYKFEDVRVQQLMSDTTDSELYSIDAKQTKPGDGRLYYKETSCSESEREQRFNFQSKFENESSQLKKKRRKQEVVCSRKYEDHCMQTLESSMDDQESIKPRGDENKISRIQRKMKSEQNLPCCMPFGARHYKNISDPHLSLRECYRAEEKISYPSSYPNTRCKRENRYQKEIADTRKCNDREIIDRTTDVDSDAVNAFCDTHRTDFSHNEESKELADANTLGKPAALPAKTQQLLNKSYMEYYDKLRSSNIDKGESAQQRHVCPMILGAPQLKRRRAGSRSQVTKIDEQKESIPEDLTLEKCSALSNIINQNINPALKNSSDMMQTTHLYVNENMKSSSDPTARTESAAPRKVACGESADLYDSSNPSTTLIDRAKHKREKPVERRLLKLKTIAFFGFMMYAMIVLLPLIYNFFLYDEYEDYEDLSYIELTLEYVVSSFREAFGGLFDAISDLLFRPVRLE